MIRMIGKICDHMQEIVISDEYNKIREEIKLLMMELAALYMERDELLYHICPELRARYAQEIGEYQTRAMYQELMILELKRRIEITRAALNKEQTISEEEVDEQVKEEYRELHEKVEDEYKNTEEAKEEYKSKEEKSEKYRQQWKEKYGHRYSDDSSDTDSSGEDTTEDHQGKKKKPPTLKELYRKIVKKLHPDVNPNASEREKELLNRAVAAYEEEDMVTLQEIYDEVYGNDTAEDALTYDSLSMEQLIDLKLHLAKRIKEVLAELEGIMADFPYNQKEFLDDPEAVKKEQDRIQAKIEMYEQEIIRLRDMLEELNRQIEELREKKRRRSNGRKRKV